MRILGMVLFGVAFLLKFLGGFLLLGCFLYGIYALFAVSIAFGFMMIGAAVVGGWVISIMSGLLLAAAVGVGSLGDE